MTEQHPITPPPELVQQWFRAAVREHEDIAQGVATRAAQYGADQELEACCEWLGEQGFLDHDRLCSARRPKPSSLKEQALEAQQRIWNGGATNADWQLIRRALEALPE
jgi:hypothetical protein